MGNVLTMATARKGVAVVTRFAQRAVDVLTAPIRSPSPTPTHTPMPPILGPNGIAGLARYFGLFVAAVLVVIIVAVVLIRRGNGNGS